MIEVVNTKEQIAKAKRRYVLNILLIVLFVLAYSTGSIVLLVTSSLKYTLPMVIDIVISVICVSFLIFYFLNIFPIVRHYFKFYRALERGTLERRRYVTFEKEVETKTKDGVVYRQFMFSFEEQQKKFYERIYVLDNPGLNFKEGQLIKAVTFQNVLLKYEEVENAKVQ